MSSFRHTHLTSYNPDHSKLHSKPRPFKTTSCLITRRKNLEVPCMCTLATSVVSNYQLFVPVVLAPLLQTVIKSLTSEKMKSYTVKHRLGCS